MCSRRQAISLFSGCGGDTLGLERAGFKVIAYNEFNKAAIKTHDANFPGAKLIVEPRSKNSDIRSVPDEEFTAYKNKADIVFAGFCCQGISRAGKKQVTDPRNQMFRQFVRAVKEIRPRFLIGENVVGLTTMMSGPLDTDPLLLDLIKDAFRAIGYEITHQILEAVRFGVPQKRKRILLVGWDTTRVTNLEPTSFWASVAAFGATKSMPVMRSFITNSMEGAHPLDTIPEGFELNALPVAQDAQPTGVAHPFVVLKSREKLLSCTKRDSPIHSEIINVDAPSKTIICTYDHQPRLLVGLRKPDGTAFVRTLLANELKQIQGFPSDFKMEGNKKEIVVQIGNAVPPALVEAVATSLKKLLPKFAVVSAPLW
jgi:DNA (cytosine-5)-methyltransferase 1